MSSEAILKLQDPKFYLESFTKIKGKTPGLAPFVLNEAQKDLFNVLRKHNRVIALKARQIGFSTAICGYLYHKTITTPGTNTALIGYNAELAAEFLDRIKTFYKSTPESLRPTIQYNSKYEITFPGIDSKIFILSGDNVGRGYTLHNVLVSELALWDKPEDKMLAIENAVPKDGQLIIESTPYGVGNLYHRMWMAENNGYFKKEWGWWWVYKEDEIEGIRARINDPMRFAQEYELEFLAAGRPVFPPALLKRIRANILKIGDKAKDETGKETIVTQRGDGLIMYKPPRPGRVYVAGADVAEGVTGGDYSVVTFFDREDGEEVAMWRGHVSADKFGERLNTWGRLYNNALMVVEINNHGLTTVTALRNLFYPQLYFRPSKFDAVSTGFTDRLGWKTTKVTRPLMIDDMLKALLENSLTLHSKHTIDEMLTFVYDDGSNMVTQHGFHDDCIFATAIGFQGFKILYKGTLDQIDYTKYMPSSSAY